MADARRRAPGYGPRRRRCARRSRSRRPPTRASARRRRRPRGGRPGRTGHVGSIASMSWPNAFTSRRPISVFTSPGATMFTWMPLPRSSFASVNASDSIACLPMLYGRTAAALPRVAADEMKTMSPRGRVRMPGRISPHSQCGPIACGAHDALDLFRVGLRDRVAAARDAGVVHEDVDRPERVDARLGHRPHVVEVVDRARRPRRRAAPAPRSRRRPRRRRPCRAGSSRRRRRRLPRAPSEIARPMPRPPPVTNALRPSSVMRGF